MVIGIDASRANQSQRTGTEVYAAELVRRLPQLLSDHRLRIYTREPIRDDLRSAAENVEYRVLRWPPGVLWSHLRLSWEMLWHRPDVLFVPANTVPIIHPRRCITTIHDVAFERFPELYRGRSVQRQLGWLRPFIHGLVRLVTLGRYSASERDYHRWSSRHAVRSCQTILTVSNFSKQEIVETLQAAPDKIVVTYLGVRQPDFFRHVQKTEAVLQRWRLTRPFMLFIGRLETKKNVDGILRAYSSYRQHSHDPLDLVLAGQPGYGWDHIQQQFAELIHSTSVHRLGYVPEEDIAHLLVAAQVFLFVSRYEGFGIPPLEAMSAGVPVIASQAGSLPEVLGPAAYFVPLENTDALAAAMERLNKDDALRQTLTTSGKDQASRFTWEETADRTAQAIRTTLGLPKH